MATDQANNRLYEMVRRFAVQTPDWADAIRYYSGPDEMLDITKVAARVYGSHDLFLVIQAAAGMDSCEYTLQNQQLILPTVDQLRAMQLEAGFDANETV